MSHHRYRDAQAQLRSVLADDPEHATAHAMMAIALAQDDAIGDEVRSESHRVQLVEATEHAERSIVLDPDNSFGYHARATTMYVRRRYDEMIESARHAVRLDPYDADYHAVLSQAFLAKRNFAAALESADRGLRVDPEHAACTNLRGFALDRMGRSGDAIHSARDQLARDPEDATAHAMLGFAHLNQRDASAAQTSFREALRLDPTSEFARSGMIEAIKISNPIYRLLFGYFAWIGRLNQAAAFAVMIGAYLLIANLNTIVAAVPFLAPYKSVLLYGYLLFALSTWVASPLMNASLRLHPFGRHLLSREERFTSNLMLVLGGLGLLALVGLTWWFDFGFGLMIALYFMVLSILVVATMNMSPGVRRWTVGGASLLTAALPWIGLALATVQQDADVLIRFARFFAYATIAIQIGSQVWQAQPQRT